MTDPRSRYKQVTPTFRLELKAGIAMGPGKAALLEALETTGSITAASELLGMSYRRAWLLVSSMNEHFHEPLVETARGGARRGGAVVTEFGRRVLGEYRAMEDAAARAIVQRARQFARLLR